MVADGDFSENSEVFTKPMDHCKILIYILIVQNDILKNINIIIKFFLKKIWERDFER